jgi:hypothetical protein
VKYAYHQHPAGAEHAHLLGEALTVIIVLAGLQSPAAADAVALNDGSRGRSERGRSEVVVLGCVGERGVAGNGRSSCKLWWSVTAVYQLVQQSVQPTPLLRHFGPEKVLVV